MNQRIPHTEPNPNSYVAAYGYKYDGFVWFKNMDELMQQDNDEEELYFYHGDHLGSSSWITDGTGNVNQYLAYMPFGESFIDQRTNHDIRFKFTTKEEDSETGYQYFGARYYSSDLSVWLSVDPLSDMYASTSPFMYVRGNPIMLIDPNGMNDNPVFGSDGTYRGDTKEGYTGVAIIYDGDKDFSKMSKGSLLKESGANTYDNATLSGSAKGKIHSHIANYNLDDGLNIDRTIIVTYDKNRSSFYTENGTTDSESNVLLGTANEGEKSYAPGERYFETTVENVRNMINIHEVTGHGINKIGGMNNEHYKAYELQINNPQFSSTTNSYKSFIMMQSYRYFTRGGQRQRFLKQYGNSFYKNEGYTEYMKWRVFYEKN
jgi:RHS repeat-associated protein